MKKTTSVLALAFAILLIAAPADGRPKPVCSNGETADLRIVACSKTIEDKETPDGLRMGAYLMRGMAHTVKKQDVLAFRDFSSAINYGPGIAPAFYGTALVHRSFLYRTQNEFDLAIKDLDEAIRVNPKQRHAHRLRAYAYSKKGEFSKAIADATRAIELLPYDAHGYAVRADIYVVMGLDQFAIEDYRAALASNPDPQLIKRLKYNLEALGATP